MSCLEQLCLASGDNEPFSALSVVSSVHCCIVESGIAGAEPVRLIFISHSPALRSGSSSAATLCADNGLLSHILARETPHQAVILDNTRYQLPHVSRTFHGRDIFAPAAACLAAGVSLDSLGTPVERLLTFPLSRPQIAPERVISHVVYVDVFGNVFLDITEDMAGTWGELEADINGLVVRGPAASYVAVPEGAPVALFGSSGHLEIAVRNGNASRKLGLRVGDAVVLRRKSSGQERTLTA